MDKEQHIAAVIQVMDCSRETAIAALESEQWNVFDASVKLMAEEWEQSKAWKGRTQ